MSGPLYLYREQDDEDFSDILVDEKLNLSKGNEVEFYLELILLKGGLEILSGANKQRNSYTVRCLNFSMRYLV
jgi:hypothetical protein